MKNYIKIFILIAFIIPLSGQSLLNIKTADVFKQAKDGRRIIYGNVRIEYDVYKVNCDSAIVGKDLKSAKLFKNVVLQDTALTIYCDKADIFRYDGKRSAYLTGNVKIKSDEVTVYGESAKIVELFDRVTVNDSVKVEYTTTPSLLFCRELKYDTKKEVISSNSIDSVFALDSLRYYELRTPRATYDLKSSTLKLNSSYELRINELVYPIKNISEFKPINILSLKDTIKFKSWSTFSAANGSFWFENNIFSASGGCKMSRYVESETDTTYFNCQSIDYSSITGITQFDKNVALKQGNMLVSTDYGEFHEKDNLIKLLIRPKIVHDKYTVTGDTIYIVADENTMFPKEATVINNAYFESIPDSNKVQEKNLMKGKRMDMWFDKEKLSKILISKEAEIVYFIREGQAESKASNYLLGDTLVINLDDDGITKAKIKGGCEGIYYPGNLKTKALDKTK